MDCLSAAVVLFGLFGGFIWAIIRLAQGLLGADTRPTLNPHSQSTAHALGEFREASLEAVPLANAPARRDPAVHRHRPWIVREWTGGDVVPVPGTGEIEVRWNRDGWRLRWFEKQRGFHTWTVVMARATLRIPHGFQVRPRAEDLPLPGPERSCSQPTGIPEFDARWSVRLSPDALDVLPVSRPVCEAMLVLAHRRDVVLSPAPAPESRSEQPATGKSRAAPAGTERTDSGDPVLDVQPARSWVSLHGSLFDAGEPRAILEAACDVLVAVLKESAARAGVAKIHLVHSPAGVDAAPAHCPVCAESILDSPARCARCETPHHRDCWTYVGACSVFGCRSSEMRA